MPASEEFLLVLIKPSHYDDDGYVIQWRRSAIPSNTLAVLYGLARDCARRRILGDRVTLRIETYDETNTVVPLTRIVRMIRRRAGGMVGLVGVQTNQFPRAVDLAKAFVQAKIPVVIGGFHVSGSLATLSMIPPDIQAAVDHGISVFAGEAEHHLETLVRDCYEGKLKPLYNVMDDLPGLERAPPPYLPARIVKNTFRRLSSFDAGRGCPYQCSFCTIINVQGKTSRFRTADDVEDLIRAHVQQGIIRFFITDDDFARNRNWEAILDRCIKIREGDGIPVSFAIQVDALCHRIPRFIEKCARAGCTNVFVGLENLNPSALAGAKKHQNKIWEYRRMIQAWKDQGCTTVAGYILGFPGDTPASIARDIDIIKNELPVDCLEFFCLTPLPGSEDHKRLLQSGAWLDPDLNKYDLEHVTMEHPLMSAQEWQAAYRRAWSQYYSLDHVETVLRRAATRRQDINKVAFLLLCFAGSIFIEAVHPLEGGAFRRKVRRSRRPGMRIVNPLVFYPQRLWESITATLRWVALGWRFLRIRRRVLLNAAKEDYTDLAMTPAYEQKDEDLTLLKVHGRSRVPEPS